jgi:hypothetical protein
LFCCFVVSKSGKFVLVKPICVVFLDLFVVTIMYIAYKVISLVSVLVDAIILLLTLFRVELVLQRL